MKSLLFLFMMGLVFPLESRAEPSCERSLSDMETNVYDVLIKDADQLDVAHFCNESLKDGMANVSFGRSESQLQDILNTHTDLSKDLMSIDAWKGSLYPNERTRRWNYDAHIANAIQPMSISKDEQDKKFAEALSAKNEEIEAASFRNKIVCSLYMPLKIRRCSKAIKRIVELTHEHGGIILPKLIQTMMNDPRYTQAAITLASTIDERIKASSASSSDLFSDTREAFKRTGVSEVEADDMAFNLLALYGARGPNMSGLSYYATQDNVAFLQAMTNVGTGTVLLDSRSMASGHPYSYPKTVRSHCDNGKPYHFWLTAYLSRVLNAEFHDSNVAATTVFIADMGYQMLAAGAVGRDPSKVFMVPCFDAHSNKLRMDMAYAAAGSTFGAHSSSSGSIDVDHGLIQMIKHTRCQDILDEESAQREWTGTDQGLSGYHRWKNIIAPDEALNTFKKGK